VVQGTGLRPYLDPLNENERTAFLAQYQEAIADALLLIPMVQFIAVSKTVHRGNACLD